MRVVTHGVWRIANARSVITHTRERNTGMDKAILSRREKTNRGEKYEMARGDKARWLRADS